MDNLANSDLWFATTGPRDAPIVLVGESWGSEEDNLKLPFVGQSGKELDRMLQEVGLDRKAILCTNVFNKQPPGNDAWRFFHTNQEAKSLALAKHKGLYPTSFATTELARLVQQLEAFPRSLVIAAGNYALWATTSVCSSSSISLGEGVTVLVPSGVLSWRGSMLFSQETKQKDLKVLPLIHPAAIMRAWYQRAVTIHDLKTRVPMALQDMWRPVPLPTIIAGASFADTRGVLEKWFDTLSRRELRLAHDIETSRRLITCMSFADGPYNGSGTALVIPFVRPTPSGWESYWPLEQEVELVRLSRKILCHPNTLVEGQNYLYDTQYVQAQLRCVPRLDFDTMLAHHLLFPGTPKGLDYLSSLYCNFHWYWKEDLKEWDTHLDFQQNLIYNGEDSLRTFECATVLRTLIQEAGLQEQWEWEKKKNSLALRMMNKGVAVDKSRKIELGFQLAEALRQINLWLASIVPQSWVLPYLKTSKSNWWDSPAQQKIVFHEILGMRRQTNRKTGGATLNFEAIENLKNLYPEFTRIFNALLDARSISVFHNTFVQAGVDPDGRLRCSFNTAGTETFRWSSSTNAFGGGTNFQNIPKGEEE